ncbi:MAG: 5-(carboxyamino)imidazole ribonucleotide synthase [Alphaproteobacteria bacterium]|nr:5-(carboxyamino)imidazole ribonucleotide synthase [Alphaproteobacteria bacterium]MBL6940017.1 5-(carboxyamino)imidazole ribonucleotide synthase [Alphaproteobacteria bacterium]MBL7098127.1 5-(carboxyamino)imidazole ribonucleotide synthase [Alphaproteobacteria bacterium]
MTKTLSSPVPPGGTIGILGGGQLGRMLALAAARLGLKTQVFCDNPASPAFHVCDGHTLGKFEDLHAVSMFARACDVVTFEFENVPAATAEHLAEVVPVLPGAKALALTQDRLEEKTFVRSLGLQTSPFMAVATPEEAADAFATLGTTGVIKTRRLGYDGKGQAKVTSAANAAAAIRVFHHAPSILEGFVDFAFEASVIAARGADGSFAAYDSPENAHEHHILRRSIVPGRLTAAQNESAKEIARKIGDALGYVGVFAVELFVMKDSSLLVNEIAPRVHNSGHWTLEACAVSQFEQHIRAVGGWPLGDPARHADAVMENIIGEEAANWAEYARRPGALHLYGKAEIRPGRKMGHFTQLSPLTRT